MNKNDIELKVMAYLDEELSGRELQEIKKLIDEDPNYKKIYLELSRLKEVTQEMKFKKLPEMYWDNYWEHIYNRLERGISWILISVGVIIIGAFLMWQFVESVIADQNIHILLKSGIFILLAGAIVLVVSVLREKLMVRKVDKYREVER